MEKQKETQEQYTLRYMLAILLQCGILDVDALVQMEIKFPGTTNEAVSLSILADQCLEFKHFVTAVQCRAYQTLIEELDKTGIENIFRKRRVIALLDAFRGITLDDNYMVWGKVVRYGSLEPESVPLQDDFVQYVRSGSPVILADLMEKITDHYCSDDEPLISSTGNVYVLQHCLGGH